MSKCFWCEKDIDTTKNTTSIIGHIQCIDQFKAAILALVAREMGDYDERHVTYCFKEKK